MEQMCFSSKSLIIMEQTCFSNKSSNYYGTNMWMLAVTTLKDAWKVTENIQDVKFKLIILVHVTYTDHMKVQIRMYT